MVEDVSIAMLAAAWLRAERDAVGKANETRSEEAARAAAVAFEDAIRGATQEDLLLAWEAARKMQAGEEIGSAEWLHARSVSELLRTEYAASRG
jgi:hypothetical protein